MRELTQESVQKRLYRIRQSVHAPWEKIKDDPHIQRIFSEDARREISAGIRELIDFLLRSYNKMMESVLNQSRMAGGNVLMDTEELSPEEIRSRKRSFEEFIAVLRTL
jgi:hypothetical protein